MSVRKGPRPLAIRVFAAAFLASAIVAYCDGLWDIPAQAAMMAEALPQIAWTRDAIIVMLSARLSIALIPIGLVWLFAANFARWMVTVLALGKLVNVPDALRLLVGGADVDGAWATSLGLGLLAVAMLFTPGANRWFAREEVDPAVFE